jgi:hypothetical protein
VRQDAPGFQRLVLTRAGEGLLIDLVKDVSPQLHLDKVERDNVLLDPVDEILANKLTAELRAYVTALVERLVALAAPQQKASVRPPRRLVPSRTAGAPVLRCVVRAGARYARCRLARWGGDRR